MVALYSCIFWPTLTHWPTKDVPQDVPKRIRSFGKFTNLGPQMGRSRFDRSHTIFDPALWEMLETTPKIHDLQYIQEYHIHRANSSWSHPKCRCSDDSDEWALLYDSLN